MSTKELESVAGVHTHTHTHTHGVSINVPGVAFCAQKIYNNMKLVM